ncbi:MAG: class A beta-lactamase [Pseudomonadales bacterium]|jgi:beta-lactamase class A|nr:class A beta-lactamase [Pseudomonadales bacterium]
MAPTGADDDLLETVQALETRLGARLGFAVLDTATGRHWRHRADERFPLASTFKAFACAAVLARVDAGTLTLDQRLPVDSDALVTYSPVTAQRVATGISVAETCEAAITLSDNTAANLLLSLVDGPRGLTAFLRSIGDERTRLDRWELALNDVAPGDPRDTTTPDAALQTLRTLLSGRALSAASTQRLTQWLVEDRVADALLRASLPEGWVIGDKTGAAGDDHRGILAFMDPPGRARVFAAIYLTGYESSLDDRNAVIAELGAAIVEAL